MRTLVRTVIQAAIILFIVILGMVTFGEGIAGDGHSKEHESDGGCFYRFRRMLIP